MLFNSFEFFIFLPIVFFIYWFITDKNLSVQNVFIVIASYIFYGWWDWRFLSLIILSSLVDYSVGLGIGKTNDIAKRKILLFISIVVNIGCLAVFKYFNFFVESFYDVFTFFGKPISDPIVLNIILPVGISFYTFQTLSYSIDTYRRKLQPTKDIVAFFAFVSFFPQLVAGPIERAVNLLPQFSKKRVFKYEEAVDGMRQILSGFFKKIVIADNCAIYVNDTFSNYVDYSGSTLLLGAIFFAFQIYGDFSGYSDIAIGTSRLFGFNLMRNFAFPYFSRDIAEFWRRWHISLTTWFRDYVYIPLGGSRGGAWLKIRNVFIIFIVSGFWHGANWTFIVWGVLNAIYFLPIMLLGKNRVYTNTVTEGSCLPSSVELIQMGRTFFFTVIAWIFFRSETVGDAFAYISKIFSISLFSKPEIFPTQLILFILLFVSVEWFQRDKQHALQLSGRLFLLKKIRYSFYVFMVFCIYYAGNFNSYTFIYFQF
ncbi:MAG: MBOAT family protein [Candidatus Magnetomorum sp.]|nr:MBOAT family protein [Candidatus Magnetomorum sp.]